MSTHTCDICGGAATLGLAFDTILIGSRKASVEVEGFRCTACGETYFSPQQAVDAQRRAAAVLRKEEGLLSPDEVRDIRARLGLTQAGLERLLGVGPKTVVRWERGTVVQSPAVDRLLRVMAQVPESTRVLEAMASGHR